MFIPGGCFCCEPPEDPCTLSGCTWSSTDMSDTDLTAGTAYYNPVSGTTPDGSYEITNAQETGTGNDAPCRKITIETVEAPQKPDTVYAICWKDNATHNPATQCPLTSVSFCVESKRHGDSDSGLTDSVVFVVRQNNRIYATAAQSVGVNWKRASGTYTQSNFTEIDGAGNPDFTAAGTSIEFGFALKLVVSEDEEPLDVVMFDNLCITKSANCGSLCNTVSCDVFNSGDPMNILSSTTGASGATATYSVSSTVGNPAGSHKFTFSGASSSGNLASVTVEVSDDVFGSGSTCLTPSQLSMCAEVLTMEGVVFTHTFSLTLRQGSLSQIMYSTGAAYSTGTWRKIVDTTRTISTSFDYSQPVQLVMSYSGTPGPSGSTIHYIDNICVKAVYGNACDIATQLSFSNPSLLRSYSGVDASIVAARSWVTSSLNATYILDNPCLSQELNSDVFGNYRYTLIWNPWVSPNLGPTYVTLVVRRVSGSGGPFNVALGNVFVTSTSILGFNECVSSNTVGRHSYNPGTQFTLPTPADEVWFSVDSFTVSRPAI